jgi:hypothetical protein
VKQSATKSNNLSLAQLRPIGERDPKPFVILSEVKQSGRSRRISLYPIASGRPAQLPNAYDFAIAEQNRKLYILGARLFS